MKKNLSLAWNLVFGLFLLLTFISAPVAQAQTANKYSLYWTNNAVISGGTNNVAVAATNYVSAFDVSEHDYFMLQLSFKGDGAGTSTVQVYGYQSIDSTTYETTPSFSKLVALNGTTLVCTNWDINVPGSSSYKFIIGNTNASVAVTNVTAQVRFKSARREPKR